MSETYPNIAWSERLQIDGDLIQGAGSRLVVDNPATGEPILELNQASLAQVDDAVKAARSAFDFVAPHLTSPQIPLITAFAQTSVSATLPIPCD